MLWIRVNADETTHPRILLMREQAGPDSYYEWHGLLQWCARFDTRGEFPEAALRAVPVRPKSIRVMQEVGLVERDGNGGYRVRNFEKHNPVQTGAERQRRYRKRKAES